MTVQDESDRGFVNVERRRTGIVAATGRGGASVGRKASVPVEWIRKQRDAIAGLMAIAREL